jgi:hypothetical protein
MKTLSRRTLLRGGGAALALPLLDAMLPARAQEPPAPPVRLFFYLTGGGAYLPTWLIDDVGRKTLMEPKKSVEWLGPAQERDEPLGILSPTLEPLEPHKKDLLVLGGLTLSDAHGFEDGHSAEIGALLTATIYEKDRLHCGVSVDQLAARALQGRTLVDALVLGLHGSRPGGAQGVGRVYAQHYSWRTPTTPTGEERNPRLVFDRLFRRGAAAGPDDAERRSVLDHARDDASRLRAALGGADRAKLDEYLASVRDVERRIEFASRRKPDPDAPAFDAGELDGVKARIPAEKGIPESYAEYDRLMVDLVALAFKADLTRVAVLTHGGYRSTPEMGVKRGHHDLQHHEGAPEKREDLQKVDRFNQQLFAGAIAALKSVREGAGSLLDRSMLVFGSGMSNGNRHSRENLPILLAGRGDGKLRPGRWIDFNWKRKTPVGNLWVELLNRAGIPTARFGDSTGGLPSLA